MDDNLHFSHKDTGTVENASIGTPGVKEKLLYIKIVSEYLKHHPCGCKDDPRMTEFLEVLYDASDELEWAVRNTPDTMLFEFAIQFELDRINEAVPKSRYFLPQEVREGILYLREVIELLHEGRKVPHW